MIQFTNTKQIHDSPWLRIENKDLLVRFLTRFGISPSWPRGLLITAITEAFKVVPYENLTKILKADTVISSSSAMRHPDELISDYLSFGTGGTCFSLTAATVAVFDALGIEVYPLLADRHYGADTHCGIMMVQPDGELLLLDPGYLLFAPVKIPREQFFTCETDFNTIELRPVNGGNRVELHTIVKNNRKHRLTFKIEPVSDDTFGKAWERSFAFEMMSYPVSTRYHNGCHEYLQGNVLAIRNSIRTERITLTPDKQLEYIIKSLGIHKDIALRALEIVNYGLDSSAAVR